jgi:hypothetical protein
MFQSEYRPPHTHPTPRVCIHRFTYKFFWHTCMPRGHGKVAILVSITSVGSYFRVPLSTQARILDYFSASLFFL